MKRYPSQCKPATKAELKWIEDFQLLAKRCPKSLWLFSASGTLHVMKTPPNGEQMGAGPRGEGVNFNNSLAIIKGIQSDGGDW